MKDLIDNHDGPARAAALSERIAAFEKSRSVPPPRIPRTAPDPKSVNRLIAMTCGLAMAGSAFMVVEIVEQQKVRSEIAKTFDDVNPADFAAWANITSGLWKAATSDAREACRRYDEPDRDFAICLKYHAVTRSAERPTAPAGRLTAGL